MDPAALLNPRGARQRGTKPTSSTFETPSFSFSNPYSTTDDNMSREPDYWQPAQPFAMQQPMSPQVNHGARAPDVPQPMNYTAAQQQDYLPAGPQFQRFDAGALLNPRSASKRPATDQEQQPERGREDSAAAGQVSLVERLHHVQERTASPAKRARTEDEPKAPKSHSAFAHGSALDLNRNSQQPPPTQGTAIDLTMSDDEDEFKVVKDNSTQVICIGKLQHVYVQAHQIPFPDPKKYPGNHGSLGRISVRFRRSSGHLNTLVIMVVDPTEREFGRVDFKTAKALAPLMDGARASGLQWMAWTQPRRKTGLGGGPGDRVESLLLGLTLQLYCPRKNAHAIGRYLAQYQTRLEDPQLDIHRYDYFNPQTHASFSKEDANSPALQQASYASTASGNYVMRSVDEIRSDVQTMFDTIAETDDLPTREASPLLQTKLYKHQKQALYFLWDKEQDWQSEDSDNRKDSLWKPKLRSNGKKYYLHVITGEEVNSKPPGGRGGILADEMGLGKTLEILSLVADLDSMAAARAFEQKAPPPNCSGGMVRPTINSRATLLVCPLSTMYNWKEQLQRHLGQNLKWINYHGKNRTTISAADLADNDLVITTYQMIQADSNDRSTPFPHVHWFRIVLDEAHTIRNANTKQSVAACSLPAQRRWAVTGTPVQNRLDDLGALFRFLHLHPFGTTAEFNQHILTPFKNADEEVVPKLQLLVSSVTLRRIKERVLEIEIPKRNDNIVRLQFSKAEQTLHDWFEQDSQRKVNAVTAGDKLGGKSYARILTAITNLRLICAHGRDLLSEEALKLTNGMTYETPLAIEDDDAPAGAQILNHVQAYDMLELLTQTDTDTCQYCREHLLTALDDDYDEDEGVKDTFGYMTSCYQVVCVKHRKRLQDDLNKTVLPDGHGLCQCPFCNETITKNLFELSQAGFKAYQDERERLKKDPRLAKKIGAYGGPSTKTQALLHDLAIHRDWSQANPSEPPIKSVVFSTWTTHLDLIEIALSDHGHKTVRLDGRMSREARNRSLTAFDNDESVTVILVSIGAGGLGLNLTKANKAFVMEPQFNPAAEAQAVDRVHRLGQTREVTIKRFIMQDSFEEKMLDLQRKKKALADLTMAREKSSKEQAAKQRLEDLRSLFK